MNNEILINFVTNTITVNGGAVKLTDSFLTEKTAKYNYILWTYYNGSINAGPDSRNFGTDEYDAIVQPYMDLWEAEKARQEEEASRPPTLAEARATKLAEVMAGYSAAFAPIEAVYPAKERETWAIQLEEARAVLANPEAETPMLSILVSTRGKGETVAAFAAIVMANNAMYRQFAAFITGQQQRMYAEVNALDSPAAITAYEVRYEMPAGMEGYLGG